MLKIMDLLKTIILICAALVLGLAQINASGHPAELVNSESLYYNDVSIYKMLLSVNNLDVEDVIAAPVPWIPESGRPETGDLTSGITFRNLPQDGLVKVFTISGSLVWEKELMSFNNPSGLSWDGRNSNGEYVSSGVYLWMVKSDNGVKTGKIIVIR
jgi:hypothetical protein